jgi:TatA/E family protein of Tat protein translocase
VQLGPAEILVVLVIALLVFGPTRLPEVGRQVGRAMRELKKFQHTITRDVHEVFSDDEPTDVTHGAEPAPTLPPKADDTPDPTEKADGS